jgi:hypothetical protein
VGDCDGWIEIERIWWTKPIWMRKLRFPKQSEDVITEILNLVEIVLKDSTMPCLRNNWREFIPLMNQSSKSKSIEMLIGTVHKVIQQRSIDEPARRYTFKSSQKVPNRPINLGIWSSTIKILVNT